MGRSKVLCACLVFGLLAVAAAAESKDTKFCKEKREECEKRCGKDAIADFYCLDDGEGSHTAICTCKLDGGGTSSASSSSSSSSSPGGSASARAKAHSEPNTAPET